MLKTAVDDFHAAGYNVRCFLDSRLSSLHNHLAVNIVEVSSHMTIQDVFAKTLDRSELSLVIAPETDGVLASLIRLAQGTTTSLNSAPTAVDAVSDKGLLSETLERKGVAVPETRCLSTENTLEEVMDAYLELSGPAVVVKPVDGVGCESISLISNRSQMVSAFKNLTERGSVRRFIIQRFVEGLPASVSLVSNGTAAQPIALNLQRISLNPPSKTSSYFGGLTPLNHPDAEAALQTAQRTVQLFKGLRGYIGVDLILSPDGPVVLEVNPRLTVSYVGLGQVLKQGLAEPMVMAALNGVLPASFETTGFSIYSKFPSSKAKDVRADREVLCPPVKVDGEDLTEIFLASWRATEAEALKLLSAQERMALEAYRG